MLQYSKNVRRKKYSFFSWNWNWQYSLNSFLIISWIPNQNWLRPFIWFDNDWFLLSLLLNELNSATTFTTKPTHNRQQYFILYIDLSPPAKPMTFLLWNPWKTPHLRELIVLKANESCLQLDIIKVKPIHIHAHSFNGMLGLQLPWFIVPPSCDLPFPPYHPQQPVFVSDAVSSRMVFKLGWNFVSWLIWLNHFLYSIVS